MFLNIVLSIDHLYSLSGSLFCMFAASPDVSWQQWSCRLFADDSPVYLYFLFFIYCLGSFCLASLSWSVSCRPAEAGCSARCSFLSRGSKTPVKTCLTDSAALNCDPLSQTSPRGTTRLWMVQLQKSMHWKNPWSFPELLALFVFPRLLWQNNRSGPRSSDRPGPRPHWRPTVTRWHHKLDMIFWYPSLRMFSPSCLFASSHQEEISLLHFISIFLTSKLHTQNTASL